MQGSNGGADRENRLMDMGGWGEEEGGTNGESCMETYTPPYVKQTANGNCRMTQGTQTRAL